VAVAPAVGAWTPCGHQLPGWDAAAERRDAQDEFHSAAQARAWADGDVDVDRDFGLDGVGRPARWSRVRGPTGVEAAALRALILCISPPPPPTPTPNKK
jgi:hypothetical protein